MDFKVNRQKENIAAAVKIITEEATSVCCYVRKHTHTHTNTPLLSYYNTSEMILMVNIVDSLEKEDNPTDNE